MKKYISIFILLIIAAFVAFNFYAAHRARKQINKFVQLEINSALVPVSVNYSKVKVPPFSGKINFSDVILKKSMTMIKIDRLQLQLGYFNFFRFYISKAKPALKHTSSADIHFKNLQYIDLKTHRKYFAHSLTIHQQGNLWDAVQSMLLKNPPHQTHVFDLTARQIGYKMPGDTLATLTSDSAYIHYIIPGKVNGKHGVQDSILFKGITWILPASYQKTYGMFLKILGLSPDSAKVGKAGFSFSGLNRKRIKIKNGVFKTKPFTLHFEGLILKRKPLLASKLSPLTINVVRMSDQLKKLITSFGLMKKQDLNKQGQLSFRLVGPIRSPQLKKY